MNYAHRKAVRRKEHSVKVYYEPSGRVWRRGGAGGAITAFIGYAPADFRGKVADDFHGIFVKEADINA